MKKEATRSSRLRTQAEAGTANCEQKKKGQNQKNGLAGIFITEPRGRHALSNRDVTPT